MRTIEEIKADIEKLEAELKQAESFDGGWYDIKKDGYSPANYYDIFKSYAYSPSFDTKEQARKANNRLWAETILLYEIARANRLNNNWKPDWADENQKKCCFYYAGEYLNYEYDYTARELPEGFYFNDESYEILRNRLTNYPINGERLNIIKIWFDGKK